MQLTASALLNRLMARAKLRHVQLLLLLTELGSVQRTADAVGMSQSSVTQSLSYIEALVETDLFQRHARGVRPTPVCVDLIPLLRQVMQGFTDASDVLAAHRRSGQGVVRLVASAAAINGILAKFILRFTEQHSRIEIHLREQEGEDQLLAMTRGEADIVVCRRPAIVPEGWRFEALSEDEVVLVCAPDHPLARKRAASKADLAKQLWLLVPAGTKARAQIDELLTSLPARPATHPLVTRNLTLLLQLLRIPHAVTMLPRSLVQSMLQRGELGLVKTGETYPMLPLGILQRTVPHGEAAALFADKLTSSSRTPPG